MKNQQNDNGSVMVETVIIFPMVLLAVMAMIYFGLFKLQEAAMLYQVQRVASEGSLMASSPGYAALSGYGTGLDGVHIDWQEFPGKEDIAEYYKAYHSNFAVLYREIFGCSWIDSRDVEGFGEKVLNTVSVFAAGKLFQTKVEITRDFWGSSVTAQVRFEVGTPGVLRFFGIPDTIAFKQGAYRRAANPAGFMRNTDLAADAIVVVSRQLGLEEDFNKITECLGKIRDVLF